MNGTRLQIANEIKQYILERDDYTVAQILYSFSRPMQVKGKTNKMSDMLDITDDQLLTRIETAKAIEDEQ